MKMKNVKITYEINTAAVSIVVSYRGLDWNDLYGKKYLNKPIWKQFNLAYIGYRHKCLTLKYERKKYKDNLIEYFFPMRHFNVDNYYSSEF